MPELLPDESRTPVTETPPEGQERTLGIHPRVLLPATLPPFNLYCRRPNADGLQLFRPADEPVYANTWRKLEKLGADMLYVAERDRRKCLDYVEEHLPALMEQNDLPSGHLAQWLYALATRALEGLLENPESPDCYHRLRDLMNPVVQTVQRDKLAVATMLNDSPLVYCTANHSLNVALLLTGFAASSKRLKDQDLLAELAMGGALHDVGKTAVPEEILQKRSELTRAEFARIRRHPREGLDLSGPFLRQEKVAQKVILEHHENVEGNGYPNGRTRESIHSFARMARLADVYDALTSRRPYGAAHSQLATLNIMASEMPGAFDKRLLRRFIRYAATAFQHDQPIQVTDREALAEDDQQRVVPSEPVMQILEPGPPLPGSDDPASTKVMPVQPAVAEAQDAASATGQALDALAEMGEPLDEDFALMKGILAALQQTVADHAEDVGHAGAAGLPARSGQEAVESDVQQVRALFSIVWQLDEWKQEFAQAPAETAEAVRLRRRMLDCLTDMRREIALTLKRRHVAIIETADSLHPQLHHIIHRGHRDAGDRNGVHLERVGFLYRGEETVHVLEPARVVVQAEVRKAG